MKNKLWKILRYALVLLSQVYLVHQHAFLDILDKKMQKHITGCKKCNYVCSGLVIKVIFESWAPLYSESRAATAQHYVVP